VSNQDFATLQKGGLMNFTAVPNDKSSSTASDPSLRHREGTTSRRINTSGVVALQYVNERKKQQARRLRQKSTPAEKALWQRLRNRQAYGLKFRRQQVIAGFIADFFCEELKLVIEVDGAIHNTIKQRKIDILRENVFTDKGLTTIRFRNEDVLGNIESCLGQIKTLSQEKKSHSSLQAQISG
jgi:very-short-patch-repair endonuclease